MGGTCFAKYRTLWFLCRILLLKFSIQLTLVRKFIGPLLHFKSGGSTSRAVKTCQEKDGRHHGVQASRVIGPSLGQLSGSATGTNINFLGRGGAGLLEPLLDPLLWFSVCLTFQELGDIFLP